MDAGLIRKIEDQARFIALRKDLPASALPPLLRGMFSPELLDFDEDMRQLINDLHGVSRKPPLGPVPPAADQPVNTGYSLAAQAIAKVFVETTQHALFLDPQLSVQELREATLLSEDDIVDALHELRSMIDDHYGPICAQPDLYVTFDKYFQDWDPPMTPCASPRTS